MPTSSTADFGVTLLRHDVRQPFPLDHDSVQTVVTSPPYWALRDYGSAEQIGHEPTIQQYVTAIVDVMRHVRTVPRPDGSIWINLGDTYASSSKGSGGGSDKQRSNAGSRYSTLHPVSLSDSGVKPKDLCGVPWRVALAMQADGWYLRNATVWHRPNAFPESVSDRCTRSHELVFLFSRSARYQFNIDAIREPSADGTSTRQPRDVWSIPTRPERGSIHHATFPEALAERCILAGSRPGDLVLDPFMGSGTTGAVARRPGRRVAGFDVSDEYLAYAAARIARVAPDDFTDDDSQPAQVHTPSFASLL